MRMHYFYLFRFLYRGIGFIVLSVTFPEIFGDTVFSRHFKVESPENSRGYNYGLQGIVFILRHMWVSWKEIIY